MEATDSDPVRDAEAASSGYPTPPELHVAVWGSLIGASVVTAPNLLAKLQSPAQAASEDSKGAHDSGHDLYRRALWAPDGSSVLALTESQQKHVLHYIKSGAIERISHLKSPSPLLDAIWYPVPAIEESASVSDSQEIPAAAATATETTTWCFADSHRDLPIRLTSSKDGHTRASYSIMNHVEKFVGPHSLAFSADLSRLYCGLYSALAVFPLSQPGLNTHAHISLLSAKRSPGGQRGIVSALTAIAHPTDPARELVAVGTFQATVGIYAFDPTTFPEPAEHTATHTPRRDEESLARICCLAGWREVEGDGITQLKFHPLMPYVVFVASRRSDYICVYDVRYLIGDTNRWNFRPLAQAAAGVRMAHLLAKLRRPGGTSHQRIYFDVDWAGRWLATGDENGQIHMWRIDTGRFVDQAGAVDADPESEQLELEPDLSWSAHQDVVGSVGFHPYEPWLVSVSGSRRWTNAQSPNDSESEQGSGSDASDSEDTWTSSDSSLKIWDFSRPPSS